MEGMVKIPFAYCCAEGGGDVRYCDCVNKNHGVAWSHPKDARNTANAAVADGGAAFPSVCRDDPGHPASMPGMSLRDWFAGQVCEQALAEAFANDCLEGAAHTELCEWAASLTYKMADAMLAERAK